MTKKLGILLALTAGLVAQPAAGEIQVTLTFPAAGQPVGLRACIAGKVSNPKARVAVLVKPALVSSYWVAPAVEVARDGSFWTMAYIGQPGSQNVGERYSVSAIAGSDLSDLHEGDQLARIPKAAATTEPLILTRSAVASTSCPAAVPGTHGSSPAAAPALTNSPFPPVERESDRYKMPEGHRHGNTALWIEVFAAVFLLTCYVALVATSNKANEALTAITEWHGRFWQWAKEGGSPESVGIQEGNAGDEGKKTATGKVWNSRGTAGIAALTHHLLVAPVFWFFFLFCFFVDGINLAPGLKAIMPPQQQTAGAAVSFDGAAQVQFGEGIGGGAGNREHATVEGYRDILLKPLTDVWKEQPLALALAAIEACLGACVFRGLDREIVRGGSLRALFRARPVLMPAFLLLTVSLGVVAGYRGYEFSLAGMRGEIPAFIAFLFGIVFPAGMAWTLDFAVESSGEIVATIVAGVAAIPVALCELAIPNVWAWAYKWSPPAFRTLLAMVCSLLWAACGGLLWSALLLNEFITGLKTPSKRNAWMGDLK